MKKVAILLLVAAWCGMASAMTIPVDIGFESSEGYVDGTLVEEQGISDWRSLNTNPSNAYVSTTQAYEGSQSLRFGSANGYSGNCMLVNTTGQPASGTVALEFYVYMGTADTGNTAVYFTNITGYTVQQIVFNYSDGKVYAGYDTQQTETSFSWSTGQWYKVTIAETYPESSYGTADYYVNDTLIATDVRDSYMGGTTGIGTIFFGGANCGGGWPSGDHYAYMDNLSITTVPEPASVALVFLGGAAFVLRRRKLSK